MPNDILDTATALRPTRKERRTLRKKNNKNCFKENINKWSTALGNTCIRKTNQATTEKKILPFPIMHCCFYPSHNFGDIKSET